MRLEDDGVWTFGPANDLTRAAAGTAMFAAQVLLGTAAMQATTATSIATARPAGRSASAVAAAAG